MKSVFGKEKIKMVDYWKNVPGIEATLNEGLTETELNKINVKADTVNIQIKDFDGNSTKWLGLNQKAGLMALKKFIEKRLKAL